MTRPGTIYPGTSYLRKQIKGCVQRIQFGAGTKFALTGLLFTLYVLSRSATDAFGAAPVLGLCQSQGVTKSV